MYRCLIIWFQFLIFIYLSILLRNFTVKGAIQPSQQHLGLGSFGRDNCSKSQEREMTRLYYQKVMSKTPNYLLSPIKKSLSLGCHVHFLQDHLAEILYGGQLRDGYYSSLTAVHRSHFYIHLLFLLDRALDTQKRNKLGQTRKTFAAERDCGYTVSAPLIPSRSWREIFSLA